MNPRRISRSASVILNALVNVLTGEAVFEVTLAFLGFDAEAFLALDAFLALPTGLGVFFSVSYFPFDDAIQVAYAIPY